MDAAVPKPFALCLIVDDDPDVLLSARLAVRTLFDEVVATPSPRDALAVVAARAPDLVLLDANFARGATDGHEGFLWMSRILAQDPAAAIVLITAHGNVEVAVEAMKRGAIDFVSKPWSNDALLATARTAAGLRRQRRAAPAATGGAPDNTLLLGSSPAMARVRSLIAKAAPTDADVMILGENGTGKELVAREIHNRSGRAGRPFQSVDLGAVSESLFDSELFGHVRGAFTDAKVDRIGRMQAADGGTLFLDEVGNLPLHLQPKLLTALEQRQVTPVGATRPVAIDVRVVSATNLPPTRLGDEAHFRQDLRFRLNTVEIHLPPLRERREDIGLLLDHFLALYAAKYGREPRALPAEVRAAVAAHDWPGNVRALRHAAERAVILGEGDAFAAADFLGAAPAPAVSAPDDELPPDLNLERAERRLVERALQKAGYNISVAAAELGLTRGSLYRRMEKHGL